MNLRIYLPMLLLGGCAALAYEKSDHFDGKRFFNPTAAKVNKGFLELLRWQLGGGRAEWPDHVENKAKPQIATSVSPGTAHITWVNHATHLIQFSSMNLITDPIFSKRASPFQWIGPSRVREPGIKIAELPKIDVVVVSHSHYDHMDLGSLKELSARFSPIVIVPLGNKPFLDGEGVKNVVELDWWQTHELSSGGRITLVPVQHWSSRTMIDRNKTLWGGYVMEAGGLKSYFGGDTGYGPHFKQVRERLGKVDFSILPIGAYEPRWFMKEQHLNPLDAVIAHEDLESPLSIASHFETFQLTNEPIDAPRADLAKALKERNVTPEKFLAPETGQTIVVK